LLSHAASLLPAVSENQWPMALPLFTETAHSVEQAVGSTAGVTGGGAEARPAEAAGVEFGGLHLSDYDKQVTNARLPQC